MRLLLTRMTFRAFCSAMILALAWAAPATAQEGGLIRDAEIENTIRTYATPLFHTAGLDADFIQIYLVNDPQINAFVAGGQRLFINTGLLMRSESANQVIGVIAHETGHIAGGHLARSQEALENATAQSIIGFVLGTAAAVLSRNGSVATAAMIGSQSIAQRSLLAYSVGQEERADQAGLGFLDKTDQSARGLLEFFEILEKQEALVPGRQDPYLRTHPLTSQRIDAVRTHVEHSPSSNNKDSPALTEMHDRMVAKLKGFLLPPGKALELYPETDKSQPARLARAIAYHRAPAPGKALAEMDSLLKEAPNDPYYNELKGQILFESGKIKEALAPYEKAVKLLPTAPLMRVELAEVQLEADDPALTKNAAALLNEAVRLDDSNADAWHFLAIADGRLNDIGNAALALAEEAVLAGDTKMAIQQATRASQILPRGSPGWLRADDIHRAAKEDQKNG